jgi:Chlamydia polymorphic membrane protein (Chlamydia_PMP) repeat
MDGNCASSHFDRVIRSVCPRLLFSALLVALALACAPVGRAAGVVSSCDETSLLSAISGGGMVAFTCSGTIALNATITISADTTIDGTGHNITISGGDAVQVLFVLNGVKLSLNKLTITNGNAITLGGGVYNRGTLTVSNSTFSRNRAGGGGAIFNDTLAILTVTNCTFSGNSASTGGAISNYQATATVNNTTFSGNSASASAGGGGAIFNYYYAKMNVTNSTFSDNSTTGFAGGAILSARQAILTVANSTFADNSASGGSAGGGGIGVESAFESNVIDSTFSGNSADGGIGGGAILTLGVNYDFFLGNNIIANSPSGGNCFLSGFRGFDNLDTDGTCDGTISPDPLLGPLQNNGGPTQTMAIAMDSPAFGANSFLNCLATDQRGVLRPQFMACDKGAYEFATANSLPTAVRNEINALLPTGNRHDQSLLNAAASGLTAALNSHNWQGTDGNHLNPSRGENVFEELRENVAPKLTHLLAPSPPSAIPAETSRTLLDNVTIAGHTLAAVAIADAAGGHPTKLALANASLAKGDADAAAGNAALALADYQFAWELLVED